MDIRNYIFSHCVSPVPVYVHDAFSGNKVRRLVPCGKCLHCSNQKKNEWTTRLYAHANYVKNVYYITLDYAPFDTNSPAAMELAAQTAATWHDINSTHSFGLHPILLRKKHLQCFFKRLRKSFPDRKFQYFACGEYGMHANGTGYGRPHFHIVLFSNDTFSRDDIQSAWTIDRYKIGNVDFNDLRANGSFLENKDDPTKNARFVFAYVCKYLQKGDFDFERLRTIEFHRAYFRTTQTYIERLSNYSSDELDFEGVKMYKKHDITDKKILEQNWADYCKTYAPFMCCSKRPAIGMQYFEEHKQRFEAKDFRLFGLSKECVAFPRYWLRKTKERLCCFQAIGPVSRTPTTNSRVGYILSVLCAIRDRNNALETWTDDSAPLWRSVDQNFTGLYSQYDDPVSRRRTKINNIELSFYDSKDYLFYYWTGYNYIVKRKLRIPVFGERVVDVGTLALDNAISLLENGWNDYYKKFIVPMHNKQVLCEEELEYEKKCFFPNSPNVQGAFEEYVYAAYKQELNSWNLRRDIIANSKQNF